MFRWACNKNLRTAVTCLADDSRHACGSAAGIYTRAWVRVLWRAWQGGKSYDPAKHKAAAHAA